MTNQYYSGIQLIDQYFGKFTNGIHLVTGEDRSVLYDLMFNFIETGLANNEKVLIFIDSNFEYFIKHSKIKGFNFNKYFNDGNLLFLEFPSYIDHFTRNVNLIKTVFTDIKIYLNDFNPNRVFFFPINKLLPLDSSKQNLTNIRQFTELLDIDVFVQLFILRNNDKLVNALSKFIKTKSEIFKRIDTHIYEIKIFREKEKFPILKVPFYRSKYNEAENSDDNYSLENIRDIYLPSDIENSQQILSNIPTLKAQFTLYSSFEELKDSVVKKNHALVFIIDSTENQSAIQVVRELRTNNPKLDFVMLISASVQINQILRMKRNGVNEVAYFPLRKKAVEQLLEKLYPKNKHQRIADKEYRVLNYSGSSPLISNRKHLTKNALIKYFTSISKEIIEKKGNLHFLKLYPHSSIYDEFAKSVTNMSNSFLILKYFNENYLVVVIKDQNLNSIRVFKNQIYSISKSLKSKISENNRSSLLNQSSNLLDINDINFPYDHFDIMYILEMTL
jgi:hypothetical protein